jgi:hypothetical protein
MLLVLTTRSEAQVLMASTVILWVRILLKARILSSSICVVLS